MISKHRVKGERGMKNSIQNIIEKNEDITDKGCIVLNAGIYFPYEDCSDVIFDATLVKDIYDEATSQSFYKDDKRHDIKYPKLGYSILTKTYETEVCSEGYPFVASVSELREFKYIMFKFGINNTFTTYYVPIDVNIDKGNPYTYLTLHVDFRELNIPKFELYTYEKGSRENGWQRNVYASVKKIFSYWEPVHLTVDEDFMINEAPDKHVVKYDTVVILKGMSWENAVYPA
jgi:hypothetical protein